MKSYIIKIFFSSLFLLVGQMACAEATSRHWLNISPEGGAPIHSFASSPSDINLIYAFSANRLFKSQDAGFTWSRIKVQNTPDFSTLAYALSINGVRPVISNARGVRSVLRVSATSSQTLFAIENEQLSKSMDGGIHWQKVSQDFDINAGKFFLLNPQPMTDTLKSIVFANNKNADDGQYIAISTDDGDHWTVSDARIETINDQPVSIEGIDPNNPDILYATLLNSHLSESLYKSIDGGLTWLTIQPSETHVYKGNLKVHPLNGEVLYAEFDFLPGASHITLGQESGYMRSEDGGQTWKPITSPDKNRAFGNLTLDPTNIHTLYADLLIYSSAIGLGTSFEPLIAKSTDSGKSWQLHKTGFTKTLYGNSSQGVTVNPLDNQNLLYSSVLGATVTQDGGLNWFDSQSDFRYISLGQLAVAKDNTAILYYSTPANFYTTPGALLYKSTDGGDHWEKNNLSLSKDNEACAELIINPKNNQNIVCKVYTSFQEKLYRSENAGIDWKLIKTSDNEGTLGQITYAEDGHTLYYLLRNTLSKSTDMGEHWQNISTNPAKLTFSNKSKDRFRKIHVDSSNANTLYVAAYVEDSKGVYKSIDGGNNWTRVFDATSSTQYFRLLMSPLDPDNLLLLDNDVDKSTVAFFTDDGGDNWRQLNFTSPNAHTYFKFDKFMFSPEKANGLFYSSTEGLYESANLGLSWDLISDKYQEDLKSSSETIYSRNSILLSPDETVEKNIECLFTWAEQQYPAYFTAALAKTQYTKDYAYRYYNNPNTYLGIFQKQKIHMLEANLTNEIKDVGYFEYFQQLAGCQ